VKASSSVIERVVNDITPLEAGAAGDAATNALGGRLNTAGTDAAGLAFDATGTTLYVTDTNNAIVKKVACT
jgi:sugar lactone lactonase YvrE